MKPLDDVAKVHPQSGGGVEIHAEADGEGFILRLDCMAALTLADEITRIAERPLRVVAA